MRESGGTGAVVGASFRGAPVQLKRLAAAATRARCSRGRIIREALERELARRERRPSRPRREAPLRGR